MTWRLAAGYAKWGAKLLMTEMFVPGGTLIVLALLLAGRSSPAIAGRLAALVPFRREDGASAHGGDLMAYYALRRVR
jgi:hypothetical protein